MPWHMSSQISFILRFGVFLLISACNDPKETRPEVWTSKLPGDTVQKPTGPRNKEAQPVRFQFIRDSVLHGHENALRFYFFKYAPDSCDTGLYDSTFFRDSEGLGYIGDINRNGLKDSFFVLYPISSCLFTGEESWDGEAYYFTDTTLPRLQTESYCCHPSSLFHVGDIDEDGVMEIGQYFSGCVGRYKSLHVYSLKHSQWKEVGHVIYDVAYAHTAKPYAAYVRKTKRNEFEMLEETELTDDIIAKEHWIKFNIHE
jgi:hypothetical protein